MTVICVNFTFWSIRKVFITKISGSSKNAALGAVRMCTNCKQLCTFITHRMAPPSETLQKQLWTDFPPFQYFHHILNCSYLRERAAGGVLGLCGRGCTIVLFAVLLHKQNSAFRCVCLAAAGFCDFFACMCFPVTNWTFINQITVSRNFRVKA